MSVLSHLTSRSSSAVLSATERASIATSLATLKARLNSHFGATVSSHFTFGSYTRDTILPRSYDSKSDVDYMVVFAEGGYQPQTYLDRLRRFVDTYYSRSEIYQSSPTIVLELNHIKFELVPALVFWGTTYNIPSTPTTWQTSNPNDFNKALTDKNTATSYNIKPVIRLAKIWNAANGYPFNSYVFEKQIVENFYWLCSNQRDYLFSVFDSMAVPYDTQWRREAVERAKRIVTEVRRLEADSMPLTAEGEVKKLIP